MNLQEPIITQVEIVGLHGDRNIIANFNSSAKILVDKNGSGKTTFLNILVGLLQGELHLVNRYEFEEVRIEFKGGESIIFMQSECKQDFYTSDDPIVARILSRIPNKIKEELIQDIRRLPYSELRSRGLLDLVAKETDISPREIYERLQHPVSRIIREKKTKEVEQKLSELKEMFPYKILYFPTYRLVEENLPYRRQERNKYSESLIEFGMKGVRLRWESITEDIRKSALQWFSKINGRMLDELTEVIQRDNIDYKSIEQPDALKIVLARSGDYISSDSRTRILKLVESGDIKNDKFIPLAYFLSNLIEIYKQQRAIDEAIRNFVKVMNEYLSDQSDKNGKEMFYDETEMTIKVLNMHSKKPMELESLSSGEKQIISIFTKLYLDLDNPEPYAIFFDEPELSLSIEWQQKFLANISESNQCVFLLAATHSPFIFENKLAPFADVLTTEFVEKNSEQSR